MKFAMALSCASLVACGGSGGGKSDTPVAPILMADTLWNFDDGSMTGLTIDGLWHLSDVRASSAPYSLRYADEETGTYNTGARNWGSIILPSLILGEEPQLSLNHLLINECGDSTCPWDRLTVNISEDDGATYTEIFELEPTATFVNNAIELSAFAGQTVTVAINFDTVDGVANDYEGAYIDDLSIVGGVWAHTVRVIGDGLVTDENGAEDSFQVALNTPPAANVTIPVSSDTPTEGLIKGGNSPDNFVSSLALTFTPSNWNVPQTVTVQGQPDGIIDDDQLYYIMVGPAVSNDTGYNGVVAREVSVVNVNTDEFACVGSDLALGDDTSQQVSIGFIFPFQGSNWDKLYISSNGHLTFGAPNNVWSESVSGFLNGPPRIAALWDDLNPVGQGSISCTNTATSMMVTFDNIREIGTSNSNNFTITLDNSGTITINYDGVDVKDALVGITQGGGVADPGETDLSAAPIQSKTGTVYELFTGVDGDDFDLSGQTLIFQ